MRPTETGAAAHAREHRRNGAASAGRTTGARVFPVEHWIRDAYPEPGSGLPIHENRALEMSAESSGYCSTKHANSGNEIVAHYRTAQIGSKCDAGYIGKRV